MKASAVGSILGALVAISLAGLSYFFYVAFGGDPRVVLGLMREPDWWGIVAMSAVPLALIGAVFPHIKKE